MDRLTVFCPFTRAWAVAPFFDALAASDVPRDEFVAYIDSDDAALADAVEERATALGFMVRVAISGVAPPGESDHAERRRRHVAMRNASKSLVGDGPLLLLEDDTLIPPDTYAHLAETLRDCAWASGVEVGRWGRRPVGAWHVESNGVIATVTSLMRGDRDAEAIDAGGFFCALTTGSVYRVLRFSDLGIGLDIAATLGLSRAGYRLMVDWRVACAHLVVDGSIITLSDARPFTFNAHDPHASAGGATLTT